MKPINLKIKGINSYVSEQVVHFDKLAESNIFGIFGETGSGKTTILDSIILVLYGVSDRDNLQNLINVNTKDAYIEFTFDMEEGKSINRYFVRRDFKLRPSGLKAEAILNDVKKKKTLAEMPDNVNAKILEIIGIGKKEFTKCIALPQGEFDRFLSDTPALRKKTLAKLFDLEQFGVILNDKLKKRKNNVTLEKLTLEEKIGVYQGINKETVNKTEELLNKSDLQVKSLERQISKDKRLAEKIKDELSVKEELLDMEVTLSIKQSEQADINFLQKQIEYTEKYGDFTILNNKYNNCIDEVGKLSDIVDSGKDLINEIDKENNRLQILLDDNKAKTKEVETQINECKLEEEKRSLKDKQIANLKQEKEEINNKLIELSSRMHDAQEGIKKCNSTIIDLNAKYKKLENTIFDNMDMLDKLSDCQTFKTKQDFALFLTITKNKIDPTSLSEVENFNIYDEVTEVVHDIEKYELGVRREISEILKDLKDMSIDADAIDELKAEYEAKNEKLNKLCDDIEEQLVTTKETLASNKSIVGSLQDQINEYSDRMEAVKKELADEIANYKNMPDKDISFLTKTLEKYGKEQEKILNNIRKYNEEKQQTIIDIEVATNNIENYKEKLQQLQVALKPFNKGQFKDKIDNTLLLENDDLPALKDRIEKFNKELDALSINVEKLREKTQDYVYTKDDYNSLLDSVIKNEEKLADLKVFINVNKITIDIQKQNLATVIELQEKLDTVNAQMRSIETLEKLLSGGALIDFVAEEYMGLITNFANSYVYKISKGKYLLNYDGDFNVIDNFNGGIKRSVKTLSGGERFIVSLSLALGISQSIAVNNNKNFNFFFIDEGFGNLSENYIEKVLQSFDALIKLDFTVGFITHVEKMQYYLNSKILVTKDNTEEGSKIDEYY